MCRPQALKKTFHRPWKLGQRSAGASPSPALTHHSNCCLLSSLPDSGGAPRRVGTRGRIVLWSSAGGTSCRLCVGAGFGFLSACLGHKESDTTERLHFHFSLSCIGEGNGSPLQCSCLENPRDGGAWWAAVYGVVQSRTGQKQLSSSSR